MLLVTDKTENNSHAEQEPRSAYGRAIKNKPQVDLEPRSTHRSAVNYVQR